LRADKSTVNQLEHGNSIFGAEGDEVAIIEVIIKGNGGGVIKNVIFNNRE